jgi:DNA-binding NtrC family response regulator
MRDDKEIMYVVDDEKVIAETLAMILMQAGFRARAFEDPNLALAAAAKGPPPDLLISDVVMPGMSGIQLAIQFRQIYPHCKVLLFSGQAASVDLLESAKREGHDFEVLLKPVHPSDLLAKLRGTYSHSAESESHEISSLPAVP